MSLQHLVLSQRAATDVIIQLFQLDATRLGLGVFYFTPGLLNGAAAVYQGHTYTPFPVQIQGLEITSQGAQPRPKLTISNIDLAGAGTPFIPLFVKQANDLIGATLTRIRVFQRFLDNGSTPDTGAHWPGQSFIVDRKSMADRTTLEWELANPLDQRNLKIPGRVALKNNCPQNYRVWNGTFFDYTTATCPHSGSAYYNYQGQSQTDPSKDTCGKRLTDCRLRFGANAQLPFQGFPGMRRI